MGKEKLIELKRKLETRYVSYNGNDRFDEITQFEIEQNKNEQGAVINLERYFENLITKLSLKGKIFDELMVSAVYRIFYKKEDFDDDVYTMTELKSNSKPLGDFAIVSFGCYKAINAGETYDSDPEEIYDGCYDEFIVSFNYFKNVLEQNGFNIGTIKSFDEIEIKIKDGRIPVTFFPLKFAKAKRLIKE